MFLKPSILNRLMKQAYKSGLVIARNEKDWLYIAGKYWEIEIKEGFIPKKTLGDIIALTGELPKMGERFVATKEGNQLEIEMPMEVRNECFNESDRLDITDVVLIGTAGTAQRLLQDEDTGKIYVVNNAFIQIVDNFVIEKSKGEHTVGIPSYHPAYGILFKNNVCKLKANFRADEKNDKILKNLEGVDITPEVPL